MLQAMLRLSIGPASTLLLLSSALSTAPAVGGAEGPRPAPFDLQAHRGGRGLWPENTLAAFSEALTLGVSTLELDCAVTKDGVVVVSHDPALNPDHTRDEKGQFLEKAGPPLSTLTYEELRHYDVGRLRPGSEYAARYPDQQPVDAQRIPRLADVFALARMRGNGDVRFNVETKVFPDQPDLTLPPEPFAEAVVRVVREAKMEARTTIQSFDWRTLRVVQKIAPRIVTVALTTQRPGEDRVQIGRPGPSPWLGGLDVDDFGGSIPKLVKASGARGLVPELPGHRVTAGGRGPRPGPHGRPLDDQRDGRHGADRGLGCRRHHQRPPGPPARGAPGQGHRRTQAHARPMIGLLKPAPFAAPLPAEQVDAAYRRRRREVFLGIFVGYAAYYLVRNNLALAIPDILKEHPEYSKAALGTALTGLSIAYGLSKFLMGSISDKSNPKYFLPLGLLLSSAIMAACGLVKAVYTSLFVLVAVQTLNGWVQGMGWPPCGKTMVHWFSTKERGLTVSTWNTAHNIGGALVANLALVGVTLFHDWGAKFYFNALIAAAVAVGVYFLLQDTPQSCGLPPVEQYKNDYPPGLRRGPREDARLPGHLPRSTCCPTATCGRSRSPTPSATSSATVS